MPISDRPNRGFSKSKREYIQKDIEPRILQISKRAKLCKNAFFSTRVIAVLGSASLPFLISLGEQWKSASIVISVLVALSIALEESVKFKETYIKYGSLISMYNRLKGDVVAGTNEFENLDEIQKQRKFIQLTENLISSTHQSLFEIIGKLEPPKKVNV